MDRRRDGNACLPTANAIKANKIYADLTATRSSVVLCPEGTGTPLAVTYLGSSEDS